MVFLLGRLGARGLLLGALFVAAATSAGAQTDNIISGVTFEGKDVEVSPIHPTAPNPATSPELEGILANVDPTLADEIRAAVESGDLTVGRGEIGDHNFGVHDSDTICLSDVREGQLCEGPTLEHEGTHWKNAAAAGTTQDPATSGPCGQSEHMEMIVEAANNQCALIQGLTSQAEIDRACEDWHALSEIAEAKLPEAFEIYVLGNCPNMSAPPFPPSCSACE